MLLYHYTNKKALAAIVRSGLIKPSNPWTAADATYGTGWYFTDLSPDDCDLDIAYFCWGNPHFARRVKCYVAFDIPVSLVKRCRKHVYMVKSWDRRIREVGRGEKGDCPQKPCSTCADGQQYRFYL